MKQYIYLISFIIISILLSCNNVEKKDGSEIQIQYDTLTVDIKGRIGQIIEFNNRYYCFVERDNPYSSKSFRDFYVLSLDGTIEFKTEVSEEMNTGYYNDLFITNDSILLKDYYDHITFYFKTETLEWEKIKEVDDLIYEDNNFTVYYLNFGEWGNIVWFKDKTTQKEYELASSFPKIHKIDSVYYLTNGRNVLEIKDPRKLKLCDTNYYYEKVEKLEWSQGSNSLKGAEILFQDTSSWYDSNFYIATSFLNHDSLFCLCVDSSSTYIGFVDSMKMHPIKIVGTGLNIFRRSNSYRGNQNQIKSQLLPFLSNDRKRKGLIEIDNNIIRVIDVINLDSAKIIGEHNADKTFQYLANYHIENFDKLSLPKLDSIVPIYGGYNVTPNHEMVFGGNPCLRVFKIIEDTTITLLLNYYFNKDYDSIKVVAYEWRETWENDYNLYASEDKKYNAQVFNKRLDNITNYLIDKLGNPIKADLEKNYTSKEWEINDYLNIRLSWNHFDSFRRIRLTIKEK